jgi:hypothetical protein
MPFLPQPLYPQINGVRADFSSITFLANGAPIPGITDIDYGQELKGNPVYGTPIAPIGYTPGVLKPSEVSFTMLQLEWNLLVPVLALLASGTGLSGYMQARFDIQLQYQLPQSPAIITDVIRGFKVNKHQMSNKQGPDALVEKVTGDCFYVIKNGVYPVVIGPNFIPG